MSRKQSERKVSAVGFHPAVQAWFGRTFGEATPIQARAWPAIRSGEHTLISAPTGSGKTLAAFLAGIDTLVREAGDGSLPDETRVLYISPLKALSNDIEHNLRRPLEGIDAALEAAGTAPAGIRSAVRTGDTPRSVRDAMRRVPPHILVTTPESFYILLSSESGRRNLASVGTVIVDEIHAVAGSKRGAHLSLSLARLQALAGEFTRIGLSATQKPVEQMAAFLTGREADRSAPGCRIVDAGHRRHLDLALEIPPAPLEAVMSAEIWETVHDRLAQLVEAHGTSLIFVNTRRLAERLTRHLSERLGEDRVTSHHGSLSRERRLKAEQKLRDGELKALVATASLELGIDIGPIDLVCQIGSPRSMATLLQRVGRSGHAVGGLPKGRLFPLSRDELVECTALLDAVRRGGLDRLLIPEGPLDVLAQQIVAETACREWDENALYELVRRSWSYRELAREAFDAVVRMLAEGFSTRRGRRGAHLYRDAVNRRLRGRRGARLAAITCGGTIPDTADYDVILEPEGLFIGSVNEDFAVESMAGDVFQLGNSSWRVLQVESGRVRVADAHGQPPGIPFWFGEAPARTEELSGAVSDLRAEVAQRLGPDLRDPAFAPVRDWLASHYGIPRAAAEQLVAYLAAVRAALGVMPTRGHVVLERFFDEAGDMHLVVHSPFGGRINRAWGLALRKRFCRKFNFELQAAATEDAIVLSLGATHSFPLEEAARYLHPASVRPLLVQALLDAPLFNARWRWTASIALALLRFRGGRRVPAQIQRMEAEDLVAVVFPDQLACLENVAGDREVPDHPLVNQVLDDCLHEAMDIDGLERLLGAIHEGTVSVTAADLTEPSPLAHEILNARPHAFLDDAPLEERRTQAVASRRWLDPKIAAELGRLDPEAIARVREEAWPEAGDPDELHDALLLTGFLLESEAPESWRAHWRTLVGDGRAVRWTAPAIDGALWVATERVPQVQAVWPDGHAEPPARVPDEFARADWADESAAVELARGRLEVLGPVLPAALGLPAGLTAAALASLEAEGFVLRGRFTAGAPATEWCERRLLARIHRYTLARLRREIEPVAARDFLRFLLDWQRVTDEAAGPHGTAGVIQQLEGYEAPAAAWEEDILPARVSDYAGEQLDALCLSGRILWTRLTPARSGGRAGRGAPRNVPIGLLPRREARTWRGLAGQHVDQPAVSGRAERLYRTLGERGACFFDELVDATGLLAAEAEGALRELVSAGLVSADSYQGLRAMLVTAPRRQRARRRGHDGIAGSGRWAAVKPALPDPGEAGGTMSGLPAAAAEHVARTLLRRYGVVFRALLAREADWLPPWRELVAVYRRLEARGDIRGGRFVAGFPGEQYALPEAVGKLRKTRDRVPDGRWAVISAADPLNLVGFLVPGPKIAALAANRLLYRDGILVATRVGGEVQCLEELTPAVQWQVRDLLMRGSGGARRAGLLSAGSGPRRSGVPGRR
ncbi:MAG TPA: DEAD/DEAH box helicase [Gammaproteobacteria bacterium]|nr:DEAD/DEAH box helicase [Gammaproteobacteria bacterium]